MEYCNSLYSEDDGVGCVVVVEDENAVAEFRQRFIDLLIFPYEVAMHIEMTKACLLQFSHSRGKLQNISGNIVFFVSKLYTQGQI